MTSPSELIVDLYERHARDWDAKRNDRPGRRLMEAAWLDRFCALVPAGGTIVDIGCGSGEPLASHLIARGFDVSGIDSSPSMIALCRERFPRNSWTVADMRALSLRTRFQGLLAWDSFFHLAYEDQRRMFAIFRAHAAAGAPLLFTSGPAHGEAIGSYQGEALYHASLDPTEYLGLLGANGFSVVAHAAEDPACGAHTVWLARRDKEG